MEKYKLIKERLQQIQYWANHTPQPGTNVKEYTRYTIELIARENSTNIPPILQKIEHIGRVPPESESKLRTLVEEFNGEYNQAHPTLRQINPKKLTAKGLETAAAE